MYILQSLIFGPLVGVLSSFFGVGGGVILIPLFYEMGISPDPFIVLAHSLCVIWLNSINNVINFYRSGKKISSSYALAIGVGVLPGVILSSHLSYNLSQAVMRKVFAIVLLLISIRLIVTRYLLNREKLTSVDAEGIPDITDHSFFQQKLSLVPLSGVGFAAGLVSGMTGLGGGVVLAPLLLNFLRVNISWIPVFSNHAMLFGAPAVLAKLFLLGRSGELHFDVIFALALTSLLGIKIGAKLNKWVPERIQHSIFLVFFVTSAIRFLV